MKNKHLIILLLPLFFSCSRNLVYFSDLKDSAVYTEDITSKAKEPIIQSGDLLSITVNSANVEATIPFNRSGASGEGGNGEGYLVDYDGNIQFPILGVLSVAGSSKSEIKTRLTTLLTQYLNDPIVNIKYLNYKITVLGEVSNPSTFTIPSEKITILEALGLAGDMTVYGKRDNVMIIKESEGTRTVVHLDMNNKDILNSPYFYLQPNDVVYVEPVRSKKDQASLTRSNISIALSLLSVISFIIFR
ncbi:MAG TPA: sugar transporter [Leeuwenhoekiella sp.]|nr:sugar transporter [Leeuwenhoekiella sp.]